MKTTITTNGATMTTTTEADLTAAIDAAATSLDASRCAGKVRDAFRRKQFDREIAQRLLRAANVKRDSFGATRSQGSACPHGQPSPDDCNTCCMGG